QAPDPGRRPAGCFFAPRCPLAADACRAAAPPLVAAGPDHWLRCVRPGVGEGPGPVAAAAAEEAAAAAPVLRLENLVAHHGPLEILHGISLDVPARSCLALVGESGSGKTTLARCIAGLHRELAGRILFRGEALPAGAHSRTAEARRRIQYIFQN